MSFKCMVLNSIRLVSITGRAFSALAPYIHIQDIYIVLFFFFWNSLPRQGKEWPLHWCFLKTDTEELFILTCF